MRYFVEVGVMDIHGWGENGNHGTFRLKTQTESGEIQWRSFGFYPTSALTGGFIGSVNNIMEAIDYTADTVILKGSSDPNFKDERSNAESDIWNRYDKQGPTNDVILFNMDTKRVTASSLKEITLEQYNRLFDYLSIMETAIEKKLQTTQ